MFNQPCLRIAFDALSLCLALAVGCPRFAEAACASANDKPSKTAENLQNPGDPTDKIVPITDYPALHNLWRLTDRIYSGGEPKEQEAFASLAKLGVKVIISVDGARPDLESAKRHGIRYVHIPIGYDGVESEARLSLTRAMRDLDGPFYIHCHHGKHRGPAAAAVACVADGAMTGKQALVVLKRAGTAEGYAGLWRDVSAFEKPTADADLPALVEIAKVSSIAAAMAKIDRAYDNLKLCQAAGWAVPNDHPDLAPTQEALLLKEGFRESARTLSEDYDEAFKELMRAAEKKAQKFEDSLALEFQSSTSELFSALRESCNQCHDKYRD